MLGVAAALALAGLAGACHDDGMVTGSIAPDISVAARHPIVVREGFATLDLLPGGGPHGLTDREAADTRAFAAEWHAVGRGPIVVEMPVHGAADTLSRYALPAIRRQLIAGGAPRGAIEVTRYRAGGRHHLAPVRLTFARLQAGLTHPCGEWPDAGNAGTFQNESYENFGCDAQHNLAAMVADPEDLIRPRAETAAYAPRRQTVLDKYTQGQPTAAAPPAGGQSNIASVGSAQ
jgi:pilus assembly protein CpaD